MVITTEFNNKIKNFLGGIDEWKFIISGSFVISMILGENYDESDIDIYVDYPFILKDPNTVESDFEEWLVEEYGAVLKMENYSMLDVRSHKYIIKNFKDINIINLPGKTKDQIKQYIKATSDLDICTSYYDGINVEFPISVLTGNCREINVKTEFLTYKEEKSYHFKRKIRQLKYRNRGFQIQSNYQIDENFELEYLNYKQKKAWEDSRIIFALDYISKTITNRKKITYSESCLTSRIFSNEIIIENTRHDVEIPKWVKKWRENLEK